MKAKLGSKQNKRRRREDAQAVNERNQRTPVEQLAELDIRLGTFIGAKKERARLRKLIDG